MVYRFFGEILAHLIYGMQHLVAFGKLNTGRDHPLARSERCFNVHLIFILLHQADPSSDALYTAITTDPLICSDEELVDDHARLDYGNL